MFEVAGGALFTKVGLVAMLVLKILYIVSCNSSCCYVIAVVAVV